MAKANALTIDIPHLVGRDHRVCELCELDHRRYLALWGLCGELGVELLPEVYNLTNPTRLMQAINVGRGRSLQASCNELASRDLILTPSLHDLCRIVVVGLADRYPKRTIKRYKKARSDRIGSDRFGSDRTEKQPRSRAPSPAEQAFIEGFKEQYGHEPTIDKPSAIALAKKVGKHGPELVIKKIGWWWKSPAGDWVKDARTIGPFLKCFDRITEAPRASRAASRFDKATTLRVTDRGTDLK